ncbi:MAG TPA: hypothetical protein VGE62_02130 [Candidatus Paceibacterota bacterium]
MAKISIKGKPDPIYLSNSRAKIVDDMRADESMDKRTWIQILGNTGVVEWSGEIGKVGDIEYDKPAKTTFNQINETDEAHRAHLQTLSRLPPQVKSKMLGRFELTYGSRHDWKAPPAEIKAQAEQIQLRYYTANPHATFVPKELFMDLIKGSPATPLHQQLSINTEQAS